MESHVLVNALLIVPLAITIPIAHHAEMVSTGMCVNMIVRLPALGVVVLFPAVRARQDFTVPFVHIAVHRTAVLALIALIAQYVKRGFMEGTVHMGVWKTVLLAKQTVTCVDLDSMELIANTFVLLTVYLALMSTTATVAGMDTLAMTVGQNVRSTAFPVGINLTATSAN